MRSSRLTIAELAMSAASRPRIRSRPAYRGPSTARTPGRTTRGLRKPSGSRRSAGSSVASSNRGGPTAAITTFEPALSPLPE